MDIYRIEHSKTGRGPYNPRLKDSDEFWALADDLRAAHNGAQGFNAIHIDCPEYRPDKHASGFESVEDLKAWFRGYRARLRRAGYICRVISVPEEHVLKAPGQCAFKKSAAWEKGAIPIP